MYLIPWHFNWCNIIFPNLYLTIYNNQCRKYIYLQYISLKEADEGEPAKKKFIFLSEQDEEGTTLYSTSSSSLLPSSSKTPLILDTNVSGAVGSVIEVTNHEIIGELTTFPFKCNSKTTDIEKELSNSRKNWGGADILIWDRRWWEVWAHWGRSHFSFRGDSTQMSIHWDSWALGR